jgi:hypothetical protein
MWRATPCSPTGLGDMIQINVAARLPPKMTHAI